MTMSVIRVAGRMGHEWQCDLIDVSNISKHNDDVKFVLVCIDAYSKKAYALQKKNLDTLPFSLQTDKGKECLNLAVQNWLNKHDINFFHYRKQRFESKHCIEIHTHSQNKIISRYFTRYQTLKCVDVLQDVMHGYNLAKHSSIGMALNNVRSCHTAEIWHRLYPPRILFKTKLKLGDKVRIAKTRRAFSKGYLMV